jgi:predicted permease
MRPFQIVGISPAGFDGVEPGRPTDVWLPYAMYNARAFGNAQFNWFRVFGRLADGVAPAQAESTLQPAFAGFRREFNGFRPKDAPDARVRYQQVPLRLHPAANGPSPLRAQFEQPLLILSGIALLVLVIAGSNVANLFLARTRARQPELAVRLAIGAGRARLVQQVLIEAALIGVGTCIVGLGASAIAAPALVRLLTTPDDPIALTLVVNWKVGVVAAALTAGVTLIFGLAPAISASRAAPMTMLRSGGTRTASRPAAMRPFVLVQVAFSLTILFIGGLLVSSFSRLMHFDPGFTRSDVLVVGVEPLRSVDPAARRDALLRVLAHLRTLPGVEAVAAADFNLVGRAWTLDFVRPAAPASPPIETTMAPVTPGFFDTMGVRLLQGRDVTERETLDADSAAIVVSESFARAYFGSPNAVGRTVDRLFGEEGGAPRHQIVGVAADTHHSLRDEPAPTVYFPMPLRATGTIHVRSSGDPRALVPQVREAVRAGDPLFRVSSTTTQAAILDRTLVRERLVALLSGFFAVVGLVLAAVGLYGVLNDSVVLRTREIGVRLALGGSRLDVLRAIVWDVVRTTVAGAAVGLASGLYLSRFVESLLFDTSPLDLRSLVVPLAALVVAGTAAAVTPALRAFRVDPVRALRED